MTGPAASRPKHDLPAPGHHSSPQAPFVRAPEGARTIFLVTFAAACIPLLAGVMFFGWRGLVIVAVSVASCGLIERLYYRVTRTPALLGRSHAYLTGLLLGLTLPPFVPWYVAVLASAFAIIVGKAIFGGVGHFIWHPVLVGRLAVAVLLPETLNPQQWNLLAQNHVFTGDVVHAKPQPYVQWYGRHSPTGADAFLLERPENVLRGLTERHRAWLTHFIHRPGSALGGMAPLPPARYSALVHVPVPRVPRASPASPSTQPVPRVPRAGVPGARPAALAELPSLKEMAFGARPGGIGETSAVFIMIAGLYLIYRNYVRWQLPFTFLAAAAVVVAVAPVQIQGAGGAVRNVWMPAGSEGFDVGIVYVSFHLLSGELMLAAIFLAPEMTSRPVTTGGQVIFALGCGTIAMLLRLYVDVPVPCYMAVLVMNTFVPAIDAIWRPRVFGASWLWRLRKRR